MFWRLFLRVTAMRACLSVVLIGLGIFSMYYVTYAAVPGNNDGYPLGWWGWFDQGEYLKASLNFQSGKIMQEAQRYPPLYPLLGAVFLPLSELHSYLPLTIFLFVGYLWMFMAVFGSCIGPWPAALAVVLGIYQYKLLILQWVIPWNSSLAAFLQMLTLVMFFRYLTRRDDPFWSLRGRIVNAVICGAAAGLLAPTRPVDLAVFMPLLLIYAIMVLSNGQTPWRERLVIIGFGAAVSLLPVVGYFGFNALLFGHPLGGYFTAIEGSGGAALADVFDRTYSHLVNADAFYAEKSADWMSSLPLLLFFLCFVPFGLLFGSTFLRVVSALILLHLALVYSFADAVPTGQFRYYNVHYFKWMYPVLPIFALYFISQLCSAVKALPAQPSGKAWQVPAAGLTGGLSLALLMLSVDPVYRMYPPISLTTPNPQTVAVLFEQPVEIDFIDISIPYVGIGGFNVLDQKIMINGGGELRPLTDVRLTSRPGGMRVLLTETTQVSEMRLVLSGMGDITLAGPIEAMAGRVEFHLRAPWATEPDLPAFPPETIVPHHVYEASDATTSSRYLTTGWSVVEDWGRWMDGKTADLRFILPPDTPPESYLFLEVQGFLPSERTAVSLEVWVDGNQAAIVTLSGEEVRRIDIPLSELRNPYGTKIEVELRSSSTISPQDLGMSSDERQLSFGLIRFGIVP